MAVKIENPAIPRYLYYYGKIIGFAPFTLDNSSIFKISKLGLIYNFLLIAICTLGFLKALERRFHIQYPNETEFGIIIDSFGITLKYGATVSFWFLLAFRQNTLKKLFDSFGLVERRAIKLLQDNRSVELKRNWRKFTYKLLLVNFFFAISQSNSIMIETQYKEYPHRGLEWTIYSLFEITIYIFMFVFIQMLIYFWSRYHSLNKNLNNFLQNNSSSSIFETQLHSTACLHDSLGSTLESFVNFFSIPMLLLLTVMFVQLCIDVHMLYNFAQHVENWNNHNVHALVNQLCTSAGRLTAVYFVCNVTETTCSEARRTICILNKSCNKHREDSKSYKHVIKVTVLQLYQRKIKASLLGLLDVDCYIFRTFASSLVMYVVFMFQLDSLIK